MTVPCEVTAKQASGAQMNAFERHLTLWVFQCIVVGIGLGHAFSGAFQTIGRLDIANVIRRSRC